MYMPHIMHTIIDGMLAAHMILILHINFHLFNTLLDFTTDMHVRVCIIKFPLMLCLPNENSLLTYVVDAHICPKEGSTTVCWWARVTQKNLEWSRGQKFSSSCFQYSIKQCIFYRTYAISPLWFMGDRTKLKRLGCKTRLSCFNK